MAQYYFWVNSNSEMIKDISYDDSLSYSFHHEGSILKVKFRRPDKGILSLIIEGETS